MQQERKRKTRFSIAIFALVAALAAIVAVPLAAQADGTYPVRSVNPYSGAADKDFLVVDVDGQELAAYCGEKNAPAYPDAAAPVGYEILATDADGYAAVAEGNGRNAWRDGANPWDNVRRVLFYGYPHDGADLKGGATDDEFRAATQQAVWYFTDSSDDQSDLSMNIVEAALDSSLDVPDTVRLDLFATAAESGANGRWQAVFALADDEPAEPQIVGTTLKANGIAASASAAAEVSVKQGEKVSLVDAVEFADLDKEELYTIRWHVFDTAAPDTPVIAGEDTIGGAAISMEIELGELDAAGTYSAVIELLLGDEVVVAHNGALDALSETVVVTVEDGSAPAPAPDERVSVSGTKIWRNDTADDRPASITVELLDTDDNVVDTATVAPDDAGDWRYSFDDLPKYDAAGVEIAYGVREQPVEGYIAIYSDESYDITNVIYPYVEISKVDIADSKELAGAKLAVKDSEGAVVDEWTTDGSVRRLRLAPGKYTLTEISAPAGYETAEPITFTVNQRGLVGGTKVIMADRVIKTRPDNVRPSGGSSPRKGSNIPATGDDAPVAAMLALAGGAVAVVAGAYVLRKRNDHM